MKTLCKYRLVIVIFLLPLIGWVFYNSVHNGHFHKLSNGEIIYHYHPYQQNGSQNNLPFPKHKHTKSEYIILQQINQGFDNEPAFHYDFSLFFYLNQPLHFYYPQVLTITNLIRLPSLRAPPVLLS